MPQEVMAGNWKMNFTTKDAVAFAREFRPLVEGKTGNVKIVICAPFTALSTLAKEFEGSGIGLGAQNVHFEEKGAFTAEISAEMLTDVGVEYVIVGHSERRQMFGETDEGVNQKARTLIAHGLTPIVCVGETLEERQGNRTNDVLNTQIKGAFAGWSAEDAAKCIIAYEPVWAIGTGEVATPEMADDACGFIRGVMATLFGKEMADNITIQYGGSMSSSNSQGLLAKQHINGGLIGGASLKPQEFATTILNVVGKEMQWSR